MSKEIFNKRPESHTEPSDDLIGVQECRAMFGMTPKVFSEWYHKGTLAGVKHPAFKRYVHRENSKHPRMYCRKDALRALKERGETKKLRFDEWGPKELLAFGHTAMFKQAVDEGYVTLSLKHFRAKITPVEPDGTAQPARNYFPHKSLNKILEAKRLKAQAFKGVEFLVEEIKE